MTSNISLSHPILQSTTRVQEICQPFLEKSSLSYFQVRRKYGNGKFIFLSNNINPFLESMERNFFSNPFFERKKSENNDSINMAKDAVPPVILSFLEEKHNIHDMITFIRPSEHYCDMISFGLPEKCGCAVSYYSSILQDLQTFANNFLLESRPLLEVIEKNPIHVPIQPINNAFLPPHKAAGYEIMGRYGKTLLSHDEFIFLYLLQKGNTKNDIAKILSMPIHKVDNDIALLAQKTGYPLFLLKPFLIADSSEVSAHSSSPFWKEAGRSHEDLASAHSKSF